MNLETMVGIGTLGVSLLTLGGAAFGLGRLYGRVDAVSSKQDEIYRSLFETSQFVRRDTIEVIEQKDALQKAAFDQRLSEISERIAGIENRERES